MDEIWKWIPGYEGHYLVSNFGRVKSKKYKVDRILKQESATGGYLYVWLSKNGKIKSQRVHRLVAKAFLPNPANLPEVNHKDENVKNNCLDNLEWCGSKENKTYGTRSRRIALANEKPIVQRSKDTGEVLRVFRGASEAGRILGFSASHIRQCCRGERETHHGFRWSNVS